MDCTLAVLAGGESRRMGKPKSHLRVGGKPILEFLHLQWAFDGPTLLVDAPGAADPPGAGLFSARVSDRVAGDGPLRGIHTALSHAHTAWVVLVTVDMPAITRRHLEFLCQAAAGELSHSVDGLFLERPGNTFVDPFPCILRATLCSRLEKMLDNGGRSVQELARQPNILVFPAPEWFSRGLSTNLNTPADVAAFEQAHVDAQPEQ